MATKKCPFCAEEIQEEAIVCKHCGRDLPKEPESSPEKPPAAKPSQKQPCPWAWVIGTFGLLTALIVIGLIFAASSTTQFWLMLLFGGDLALGSWIVRKTAKKKIGFATLGICLSLLLLTGLAFSNRLERENARAEAEELERVKAQSEEIQRQRDLPIKYESGSSLLKEGKYQEAIAEFRWVIGIDPKYKDVPQLLGQAEEGWEKQREEMKRQEAMTLYNDARKKMGSRNCGEMRSAEDSFVRVKKLDPERRGIETPPCHPLRLDQERLRDGAAR